MASPAKTYTVSQTEKDLLKAIESYVGAKRMNSGGDPCMWNRIVHLLEKVQRERDRFEIVGRELQTVVKDTRTGADVFVLAIPTPEGDRIVHDLVERLNAAHRRGDL